MYEVRDLAGALHVLMKAGVPVERSEYSVKGKHQFRIHNRVMTEEEIFEQANTIVFYSSFGG